MWSLSVVGAFDRFNYGDVLFAKIAEHMCAEAFPDIQPAFFALRRADLRAYGGVRTQPISELYKTRVRGDGRHMIMLAGGELLAPTWAQMAEHLLPYRFSDILRRVQRRTGHARWARLWRRVYGAPNLQPWTIDPLDLPDPDHTAVVYNAVGGTSINALSAAELDWQAKALSRAQWLSVRDAPTADAVQARGLPRPQIVPDSAVIMASLLPDLEKYQLRTDVLKRSGLSDAPYVCVQAAEKWSRGNEDVMVAQLRAIHERTGANVLSFAIGRVAGHNDQITSARLKERLADASWFAVAPELLSVSEIMALIGGARAYVGTSLHGYITAFAFGAARVGLMPHLGKVIGFRDAWDHPDMPAGIEIANIADALDRAIAVGDADVDSGRAQTVANIYRESFAAMIEALPA